MMKSLSRISTVFIVFTFVFASENNSTIDAENTDVNNTDSNIQAIDCLLYTSPSPRDGLLSRMPSSA